ncbi:sugar MFS transporter [uncultured Ruminococcus sp.]|uniref:MFS transporter n=1 Tax=uncultured Ruminococcus sp. TaxID=165186 RepID=UPI0026661985|nr:MFS transporter [uncultured Ruminococcus sp.]
MRSPYQKTMYACFIGYIVQAVVNNFVPLLFVTFQKTYQISLSKITFLITINFLIQLLVDMLSAGFVDKIGYRASIILAHVCAAAGLLSLTILPELLPNAYSGILIAVAIYAVGGGLIEVLISPILEACPTDNKEQAMSLLHSFYCWGHMGVVLLSTVFFALCGIDNWKILTILWVLIPIANILLFAKVPIYSLHEEGTAGLTLGQLFRKKLFWVFFLMMLCAGASEQAVSQWASAFAEQGLGVSKTVGDLAGPMAFAMLMGISRLIYGKWGDRLNLDRFMQWSCLLCIAAYLCIVLVPVPVIGLLGCAVCGFSVGILWPGTFSKASASIKGGGTAMFAMLALAGDVGCSGGPTLAGLVSGACGNNLHMGILAAIVFPVLMLTSLFLAGKKQAA